MNNQQFGIFGQASNNQKENFMKQSALNIPLNIIKRLSPLGLIADNIFSEKRFPLFFTTGVFPFGENVFPA